MGCHDERPDDLGGFFGFRVCIQFLFYFFGSHWKCSKQKIEEEEEEERRCSAMSSPRSALISFFFLPSLPTKTDDFQREGRTT